MSIIALISNKYQLLSKKYIRATQLMPKNIFLEDDGSRLSLVYIH